MADICRSDSCERPILPGERMVQVARGYWYEGAITPTLHHIETEWHEKCYPGLLRAQRAPYVCADCRNTIRHGQYVTYITVGDAPGDSYSRPERRGYELAYIAHFRCPKHVL